MIGTRPCIYKRFKCVQITGLSDIVWKIRSFQVLAFYCDEHIVMMGLELKMMVVFIKPWFEIINQ